VLCLGVGGGGDVVGAMATSELVRSRGRETVLGGTTWERSAVDPEPGPRSMDEVVEAERLGPAVALAGAATRLISSQVFQPTSPIHSSSVPGRWVMRNGLRRP
jgi:hypothetical protein